MEQRRLYRSRSNRIIFGVAGGLADYFKVDPIIMRLMFVALALLDGVGIVLYLIGAIFIPETPSDKTQKEAQSSSSESTKSVDPQVTKNDNSAQSETRSLSKDQVIGVIVVLLGILLLFNNILPSLDFGRLWPVILIIIGLILIVNETKKGER